MMIDHRITIDLLQAEQLVGTASATARFPAYLPNDYSIKIVDAVAQVKSCRLEGGYRVEVVAELAVPDRYATDIQPFFNLLAEKGFEVHSDRSKKLAAGTPIEELGLYARTLHSLQRHEIATVEQLCGLSPSWVLSLKNVGSSSLEQVRRVLATRGLHLLNDERNVMES